jgi:hypothetical protein
MMETVKLDDDDSKNNRVRDVDIFFFYDKIEINNQLYHHHHN